MKENGKILFYFIYNTSGFIDILKPMLIRITAHAIKQNLYP